MLIFILRMNTLSQFIHTFNNKIKTEAAIVTVSVFILLCYLSRAKCMKTIKYRIEI